MSSIIVENNEFIFDSIQLDKASALKNIIKVPVTFVSEMVKYYSEVDKYLFMPYEEIRDGIKWHQENMPRIPITLEHAILLNKDKEMYQIKDHELLGYVSQLECDDEKRIGKGIAYFTRSRLHPQIVDALLRGHVLGVSVGGFNSKFGPPGFFKDQKYDAAQMGLRYHHVALITMGLPRCPTNMCGFNFTDAKFPWNECITKMKKKYGSLEKAEKVCGSIKDKYGDAFELIKHRIRDSSSALRESISTKIEFLYNETRNKKKKPNREQIQAQAYSDCRKKLGVKDNFDISLELAPEDFKDFHEQLIMGGTISHDSCVRDFWDAYRGTIEWLEFDVINNELAPFLDNLLSNKKNIIEAKKMSEQELDALKETNKALKAEIEGIKNAKFVDAEKEIKELREANKQFAEVNTKLEEDINEIKDSLITYKKEEIAKMQKVIYDSKAWTPEEIKAMDFDALKGNYNVIARLAKSEPILRPTPSNQYSTLPRPNPANTITDAEPELSPRKWKLGMPPPMNVILNAEHEHWKTRFPKKVS